MLWLLAVRTFGVNNLFIRCYIEILLRRGLGNLSALGRVAAGCVFIVGHSIRAKREGHVPTKALRLRKPVKVRSPWIDGDSG